MTENFIEKFILFKQLLHSAKAFSKKKKITVRK